MSARAGIVVTGTEVLTGQISDANGPWVAQQLLAMGVDVAHIVVGGDRPDDLRSALEFLAGEGVDLVVTSGGLGPTADDLTLQVVADWAGRELRLDEELEQHITAIVARWHRQRGADPDTDATRAATRKQAYVPEGAEAVPPTGTAPGMAVPGTDTQPAVLVLPGPPRELQSMWPAAIATAAAQRAVAGRVELVEQTVRMFGTTEAELAETLRDAEERVAGYADLEVTTCLRRGELEMVTRFDPTAAASYDEVAALVRERHGRQVFSEDGATVDAQVAELLAGRRVATAESCTGGLVAGRLTERAGSSAYVVGGVVAYDNAAKTGLLDVPADLIEAHGAVSEEVAAAMATGALARLGADVAVSTTGVAGPGGGTETKPVGTVCFGLALGDGQVTTRRLQLPGDRAEVRERSVTVALHLLREALTGTD